MKIWLRVLLAAAIAGCGGASAKTQSSAQVRASDERPAAPSSIDEIEPVESGTGTGTEEAKPAKKKRKDEALGDDYEIRATDCQALADVYRAAWMRDERKKLDAQKFAAKLRAKAEQNLENAADKGRDNWIKQCLSIVDSPYPRARLDCAVKAKGVKPFMDCWEGRTAPEEKAE